MSFGLQLLVVNIVGCSGFVSFWGGRCCFGFSRAFVPRSGIRLVESLVPQEVSRSVVYSMIN